MAVCVIAKALATTVGPGFTVRIAPRTASSHRSTTSSFGDGGYWSNARADALPGGLPGFGGAGFSFAPAASCGPNTMADDTTSTKAAMKAFDVLFDICNPLC